MASSAHQTQVVNLADSAFGRLERLIVTLDLPPGAAVTERQIVDLVNMGRTPVREAVQRLVWMGLFEVRPRKGLRVSAISVGDFGKVLATRAALEPMLASAAAVNATDAQRHRMIDCRAMMDDSVFRGDVKLFMAADKTLDRILADAANNDFLARALEPLQFHARRLWFHYFSAQGIGHSAWFHIQVMAAVIAGDPAGAFLATQQLIGDLEAKVREFGL